MTQPAGTIPVGTMDEKQPGIRHRYLADRIMLLLLYRPASEESGIDRLEDGSLVLRMGRFATLLRLNSSKTYDQLLFLQSLNYISLVDPRYGWGKVRVVLAPPLTQVVKPK